MTEQPTVVEIDQRLYRFGVERTQTGRPIRIEYFNTIRGWREVKNFDRRDAVAAFA